MTDLHYKGCIQIWLRWMEIRGDSNSKIAWTWSDLVDRQLHTDAAPPRRRVEGFGVRVLLFRVWGWALPSLQPCEVWRG